MADAEKQDGIEVPAENHQADGASGDNNEEVRARFNFSLLP
jgi:hypothetical protein